MSRGERLLRREDLLAGPVRLQAHRGLPAQEVQHGHRGDHEPGRDGLHRGRPGLQGKHQERVGVRGELPRLLPHRSLSRWGLAFSLQTFMKVRS